MRGIATTLLDAIGLLAFAAGVGLGAGTLLGWWGLALAGVVILAGSGVSAWLDERPQKRGDT